METQRLILFVIFFFSAYVLWMNWEKEHRPPAPAPTTATKTAPAPGDLPAPSAPSASVPAAPSAAIPGAPTAAGPVVSAGQIISIKTDLLTADIDTAGGVIAVDALAKHRDVNDLSKPYLILLRTPERTHVAQSGLLGPGLPNHRSTVYEPLPGPRELAPGADTLEVRLAATGSTFEKVVQVLTFHRGSYVIDVAFEITNTGTSPSAPYAYFQLARDMKSPVVQSSMAPAAYVGPVLYNEADKFKKVEFSEIDKEAADPTRKLPYTKNTDNGWIGMVEHYFVAAWLPSDEKKTPREFYAKKLDNGLDLVVDYGIFTVIAAPLFWLLKWLHGLIGNWGWAILAMTILIKSAFYPLNH